MDTIDIRKRLDDFADDVLLDDRQLSALTGLSVPTLKRWRSLGTGPIVTRLGGRPRVRVADYRRFVAENRLQTSQAESDRQTSVGSILEDGH